MKNSMLDLVSTRADESMQLWVAGCSYSHGAGVNKHQRYGQLISNKLNLPVSFLTQVGTSVDWAADQILRSDIRSGDIVIWGLTGSSRFAYTDQKYQLHHVCLENFDRIPNLSDFINKKFLISNHMIYNTLKSIEQVRNYLNKLSCKFVLAVFPANVAEHDVQILDFTSKIKNSVLLFDPNKYEFIDYGYDNMHPGPAQHNWYANKILTHIGSL